MSSQAGARRGSRKKGTSDAEQGFRAGSIRGFDRPVLPETAAFMKALDHALAAAGFLNGFERLRLADG